jgi:hypothetical protein
MQDIRSSESTEGNPGDHQKNSHSLMSRPSVLPFAAALLALAWLWAAPRPAFAQHGGGHAGGGGGHASGGGHPSGAAPASHPGGAAPAAHSSASGGVVSTRTSVPSASSVRTGERGESGSRSETGQHGDLGEGAERGGADATTEPAPHVVYGGYGYFVRENESAPAQHYTASSHIWQQPASRPPTNVTLPSNAFTAANHMIAAPTQPAIRLRGTGAAMTDPRGVSVNSALIPIPVFGTASSRFGVNNFGFGSRRGFRGRGGFGCFNFAFGPCGGLGYGFGLGYGYGYGYGYGSGYGYWGGGYDINPADFNAQDVTAPNPWMGDYVYEGSDEAAQVEAATAPGPLTVIYFKDGSSYGVRDYWMDAGQLHYVTSYGGENSVDADRVDLQRTVDENAKNGIDFTLRPAQPGSEKP